MSYLEDYTLGDHALNGSTGTTQPATVQEMQTKQVWGPTEPVRCGGSRGSELGNREVTELWGATWNPQNEEQSTWQALGMMSAGVRFIHMAEKATPAAGGQRLRYGPWTLPVGGQ